MRHFEPDCLFMANVISNANCAGHVVHDMVPVICSSIAPSFYGPVADLSLATSFTAW